MKRENYLSWKDYFMTIAFVTSMRSKDPNTQVGACIVNQDNKIVGTGYNGMPNGCSDDDMPWGNYEGCSSASAENTKYPYVCHAELNAILNCVSDLRGCTIYSTLHPCNECAKAIIQSGIKKVIYSQNKYPDSLSVRCADKMFQMSGIETEFMGDFNPAEFFGNSD